jgi:hypothetical protein
MTTPLVAIAQDTSGQPGGEQSRAPRSDGRARMGMPPRPANPEMMTVAQVEQYFDQFVLFQAQARLALTDAQFLRFGAALRQLQDARRMQQRRRVQLLRQLGDLLAATEPDDAQISAKTKEVDDLLADGHRRVQDAYAAIDGVLSLRQRARFRVFEEAMERRKLDLLARARQQAGSAAPAR